MHITNATTMSYTYQVRSALGVTDNMQPYVIMRADISGDIKVFEYIKLHMLISSQAIIVNKYWFSVNLPAFLIIFNNIWCSNNYLPSARFSIWKCYC